MNVFLNDGLSLRARRLSGSAGCRMEPAGLPCAASAATLFRQALTRPWLSIAQQTDGWVGVPVQV